jgi:PiT family inorganic phosphate transporter
MELYMTPLLIAVIVLALAFDFLNGVHDSSNIVATMISSRALSPRVALAMTATAEFLGPFIFGVAVAETVGGVADADAISLQVLIAALSSAILWNLFTWYIGMPSSSSHALVGGMIGAVVIAAGWSAVNMNELKKIFIGLFTSPFIGFIVAYILMKIILLLCWKASPKINWFFKRGQIFTGLSLALSHGTNDAQKTMGIITLALVISGYITTFVVPTWVIFLSSTMIALGTATGGWRLIRTLGGKIFKIRPLDGFTSQLASSIVILGASLVGAPVSTTQVVSSSIMGAGSAVRLNKVRWGVAQGMASAWLLTIPSTALVAAGLYWILIKIFPI